MRTLPIKTAVLTGILLATGNPSVHAEGDLNIFIWADSISPELITKFSEQEDITVNVDSFGSNEDALTKLQAGSSGFDLITPSQHFVRIMIDSGLLMDFDAHDLAAFDQVDDKWKAQWWDPDNSYSIPMAYGSAGFAVNRDEYTGPIDSWGVFFEPAAEMNGKIANLAAPDEVVSAAQLYLGVEFCSEDSAEMKKVYDLLLAQKESVATYSSDNIENRLGSGEVAMHFWWDGNTLRTRNNGANIEYAAPKEGLVGWMDSFVVPKGASNLDNAKQFINFMSTPENATIQYNYYAHSSPVELDLEAAVYKPDNASELFPEVPVKFAQACSPAAQELVNKVWTQLLQ